MMDIHTATEVAYKNGYAKGFADGKTEVAREIFEEIEKLILRYYNDEWYTVPDMWCDVEMLKKKYTEGR